MACFLFVTTPNYDPDIVRREGGGWWSCSKTTRAGDRIFVYMAGGHGLGYEWRANSDARPHKKWKYECDVEWVRNISPPLTLTDLVDAIPRAKWAPPHLHFRGYRSIRVPFAVEAILDSLRPPTKKRGKSLKQAPAPMAATGNGAGFGSAAQNKKVEAAAMKHVVAHYKRSGWNVTDCSKEYRGYDLECRKGIRTVHCEVKGVSGLGVAFPITKNEMSTWSADPDFVLAVVTGALSKPHLHIYAGQRRIKDFAFSAISFMATLR